MMQQHEQAVFWHNQVDRKVEHRLVEELLAWQMLLDESGATEQPTKIKTHRSQIIVYVGSPHII